jgi:PAS domain S-box-containing protein
MVAYSLRLIFTSSFAKNLSYPLKLSVNFLNTISQTEFKKLLRRALVLPVLLFLIVSFLFFWQLYSLRQATEMVAHSDRLISQSNLVLKLLLDAQTASRGFALTRDPNYLDPYHQAVRRWDAESKKLLDLARKSPEQLTVIQKTLLHSSRWFEYVHQNIEARRSNVPIENLTHVRKDSYALFLVIRQGFDRVIESEEVLRDQGSLDVLYISRLTLFVGIFAGLCVGALTYFYSRSLLVRLSDVYDGLMKVAEVKTHDLEESELRYKLASEATKDAIWEFNLETQEVIRTDTILTEFGYRRDQVENTIGWWRARAHPEDVDSIASTLKEAIDAKKTFWSGDYRFLLADGTYAHVRDRAVIYFKNDRPSKIIGAMKNITQEVLEIEKRQEAEKVRDIFFNLPSLLLVVANIQGVFLKVNSAWTQVLGYSPDEMEGRNYIEFVHPDDRERTLKTNDSVLQGNKVLSFTNRYLCKNGSVKWLHWNAVPIGETVYSFVSDITELQNALESRDKFLSIASHELKTPLTSLQLQVQMAKRTLQKEGLEKLFNLFDHSELSLKRINRLVDDMLDISRISGGKLVLNLESFDLKDLIKDLTNRMGYQFEAAGIKVEFQQMDSGFGNWDKFKIEQVMTNVFSNAIKYAEKSEFVITLKQEPGRLIASFRDTGPGISEEDQKRIFQQFERASHQASGMGLGLYISREIVERHRGTLTVSSAPDRGCEFQMILPIS